MPRKQVPTPQTHRPPDASAATPPAARPPVMLYASASVPPPDVTAQRRGARCCRMSLSLVTWVVAAKGKGQSQARVNINTSLVEDIINLEEVDDEMKSVTEALKDNFNKTLNIRTSPGSLDHITVVTADGKLALNQISQISMKSPQLILVNMASFPECTAAAIKAIRESGMNLNPEVEGTLIQVPIPKVTREHREMLVKLAKQHTNKAKDSLRRVRSNAMNKLKKSKDKTSEDTIKLIEKQISQMADDTVVELDKHLAVKTKELLG
ncbi:ribosome-recycling factor, mitochondrial isoform X4 [Nycticebus coucang]|uniref:ribosome-recycling factor, mitochondrial isoform X4 n=1 Tax=Nycticebus coucang TaxID=9470 RepID=UPI00234C5233|nr:ribosome-recycling factor, mitochondrial isoform X4 [Nycticebus coucang]